MLCFQVYQFLLIFELLNIQDNQNFFLLMLLYEDAIYNNLFCDLSIILKFSFSFILSSIHHLILMSIHAFLVKDLEYLF